MKTTMNTFSRLFTSLEALLGGAFGIALSFIAPIAPFFWMAGGLVVLDTITGIIAARRKKEFKSRKLERVVSKLLVYMSSILACYVVEVVLKLQGHVTYFAVGAIALTELMSILENTRVVSGANVAGVVGGLLSKFQKVPEQEPESEEEKEQ